MRADRATVDGDDHVHRAQTSGAPAVGVAGVDALVGRRGRGKISECRESGMRIDWNFDRVGAHWAPADGVMGAYPVPSWMIVARAVRASSPERRSLRYTVRTNRASLSTQKLG